MGKDIREHSPEGDEQVNGNIYTDIAEALREIGGIDSVGVVTAPGETAIIYAGNKVLKKYYGGNSMQSLIFSISAMGENKDQKALVDKLCSIGEALSGVKPVIPGIFYPSVKINSLPAPTMHNEHYWIYTSSVEFTFTTKG